MRARNSLDPVRIKPIAPRLLRWYDQHKRTLPWRAPENQTPYRIWLSEVMLQQTTVATVIPYYQEFLARWPDVDTLAAASQEDIMAAWAGLGYYHRARNLHACAQTVVTRLNGVFPSTEGELRALPGIGPYTAAAVAALAFDQPANVVDGNVERVISRLFASGGDKTALKAHAASLVPARRTGDYAQALMDLGATVCTPRAPRCLSCPVRGGCRARAQGNPEDYPRKRAPKVLPLRRGVACVVLDCSGGRVWVRRRPSKGLLGGMLECPSSLWVEGAFPETYGAASGLFPLIPPGAWRDAPETVRHVFTHFILELRVTFVAAEVDPPAPEGQWLALDRAAEEALPTVMRKVLQAVPTLQREKFTRRTKRV